MANAWLEGTYSEVYPDVSRDEAGMRRLFRQFSFPGGIPSHVAPETPGSIHEGGELGYALAHAYGAAFDNPDLLVGCVVGDGEAETGPLAASWHSNKFLDPVRDGAVLPILHLNGYKIANPTVLARIPHGRARRAARAATATGRSWSRATTPRPCTARWPRRSTRPSTQIAADPARRPRAAAAGPRPAWPMIVLRTPKGWTGPAEVDGVPVEGTWRAHQVPLAAARRAPRPPRACSRRGCAPTAREELFDDDRRARRAELLALPPRGARRMSANPHANGGAPAAAADDARLPRPRRRGAAPGRDRRRGHAGAGRPPPRRHAGNAGRRNFRLVGPGRDRLQPARTPSSRSPTGPGRPRRCPATTTWPRTAG